MALRSRPQAKQQLIPAALLQEIGIPVAGKSPRPIADAENPTLHAFRLRYLELADVCLVVTETLVFRRISFSQLDRHARFRGHVDHGLVHALRMHVNFDLAATAGDGFEERFPEGVASFRNTALPVYPKREPLNLWARLQDHGQSIAGIRCMVLPSQAFDAMMCMRTVRPLVSMGPDSQLKLQAPGAGLSGDKT